MKIFLVRHGETQWNRENRILGRSDIQLNNTGFKQAYQLSELLSSINMDIVFTSPLQRAVETAKIIVSQQKPRCKLRVSYELIEQDFGIFEGLPRNNDDYQVEKQKFFKRYANGESFLDVASRVYPFLEKLKCYEAERCLLVTHNGICRIVSSYFCDMENNQFVNFSMKNCEVKEFVL